MRAADNVRITSAAGTNVSLSLSGRECLPVVIRPGRGMPYGTPIPLWGEYNWAPVRGSVSGTIVIDGITEATSNIHVVDSPVRWTVEADRVINVEGGEEAEAFRRVFEIDTDASLIGEIGIGGNHFAMLGTETEKARLGTVHFGVGNNAAYPGGDIRSEIHVDGGVRDAVIEVDGRVVMENGRFLLDH
jgi:leucyl aminopeptidase (aminopeptidase T)